jgi:uncharacterized protein (DUF2164 family)
MKKDKERIRLSKEKREQMTADIKSYFLTERDEELGELGSGLMLDFIIEKLAPEFYNQGVEDACRYMGDRVEDVLSIQIKSHYENLNPASNLNNRQSK